jgi:predicted secreted Zn-dependent protease
MNETPRPDDLTWRTSSHSGSSNACVAAALLPDGGIAVRNSNHPDAGLVTFTAREWDAFLAGVRDGEFDRPQLGG